MNTEQLNTDELMNIKLVHWGYIWTFPHTQWSWKEELHPSYWDRSHLWSCKEGCQGTMMRVSPGPNAVPTFYYIYGGEHLINYLVAMFKISVQEGHVPETMKHALISPVFKGGDNSQASCYCPIALTTQLSKILERVIQIQLVDYLETNRLLDCTQHSLRPGRPTITQLLQ